MDSSLAMETWKWSPLTSLEGILEELAAHAEQHPEWLDVSGTL
jgi:CDP-paratose 2-epimerase